jgi:hypothetical protein
VAVSAGTPSALTSQGEVPATAQTSAVTCRKRDEMIMLDRRGEMTGGTTRI